MTFRVATKGVTPFCRHPSDLSELGREPKLDHVTPVGALNFHKHAGKLRPGPATAASRRLCKRAAINRPAVRGMSNDMQNGGGAKACRGLACQVPTRSPIAARRLTLRRYVLIQCCVLVRSDPPPISMEARLRFRPSDVPLFDPGLSLDYLVDRLPAPLLLSVPEVATC